MIIEKPYDNDFMLKAYVNYLTNFSELLLGYWLKKHLKIYIKKEPSPTRNFFYFETALYILYYFLKSFR